MPWLLRHHRYQLPISEIDLVPTRPRSFRTLMRANLFLCLFAAVSALTLGNPTFAERAPETPKKPVSTEYHGVTVEDPYQWLEEDTNPQVKAWSAAQNQRTRQCLDKLPDRPGLHLWISIFFEDRKSTRLNSSH